MVLSGCMTLRVHVPILYLNTVDAVNPAGFIPSTVVSNYFT